MSEFLNAFIAKASFFTSCDELSKRCITKFIIPGFATNNALTTAFATSNNFRSNYSCVLQAMFALKEENFLLRC